ncbi:Fcf2 pre-rRNA processing-domain-containing protein [Zopfochytrium polystomum]|nr:Fcf2 pre-rRNA processing-domain-containing protein [Zopfochytrium polystomum]
MSDDDGSSGGRSGSSGSPEISAGAAFLKNWERRESLAAAVVAASPSTAAIAAAFPARSPAGTPKKTTMDLERALDPDEADLDRLLVKATAALKKNKEEASSEKRPRRNRLDDCRLEPGAALKPYLVEKNSSGPVRIDPARIQIKDSESRPSQVAPKTGVLEKVVIANNTEDVPPELDHDDKTKKKMVVETAGPKWFDMKSTELTDAVKHDLMVINARSVLDPKRHYKNPEKKTAAIPKFFQIGTIETGAADFYSARLTRKDRSRSGIVEDLLSDPKTKSYINRKMVEIHKDRAFKTPKRLLKKSRGARVGGGKKNDSRKKDARKKTKR